MCDAVECHYIGSHGTPAVAAQRGEEQWREGELRRRRRTIFILVWKLVRRSRVRARVCVYAVCMCVRVSSGRAFRTDSGGRISKCLLIGDQELRKKNDP